MTEIIVGSSKRNRLYVRRFDHDEARRRHAAGETTIALAREYGVTHSAVHRVVTPGQSERQLISNRRHRTVICEDCGGEAMALVGSKAKHNVDGRVLCVQCRGKLRRERFRFDENGLLIAVRCVCADCANGERWQPPDHFPGNKRYRDLRPKGIDSLCRACNTRAKRAWRKRTGGA